MGQCCGTSDPQLQNLGHIEVMQPLELQFPVETTKPKDSNETPSSPIIQSDKAEGDEDEVMIPKSYRGQLITTNVTHPSFDRPQNHLDTPAAILLAKIGPFPFSILKNQALSTVGPIQLEDGIYEGQWLRGERAGFGKHFFSAGHVYEGEWRDDQANGYGRLVRPDGEIYVGQFKHDQADGVGKFQIRDGSYYEGRWERDKQHGYGVEEWINEYRYEGDFSGGCKTGKGKFVWSDGTVYEGDVFDGQMHGIGFLQYNDGRKYQGEFFQNQKHGSGELRWWDGKVYKGQVRKLQANQFVNDKREGFGVLDWGDGRRYEGNWKDNKQDGEGVFIHGEKSRRGQWSNGQQVKWMKSEQVQINQ